MNTLAVACSPVVDPAVPTEDELNEMKKTPFYFAMVDDICKDDDDTKNIRND